MISDFIDFGKLRKFFYNERSLYEQKHGREISPLLRVIKPF